MGGLGLNKRGLRFARVNLSKKEVEMSDVIDVGSRDVNGSLKKIILEKKPFDYLGVDIQAGKNVDQLFDITKKIPSRFYEAFEVVLCFETIEHVKNWRKAINNLKRLVAPRGVLLLSTRSKGFPKHNYPYDFWRFEKSDIKKIFSDFEILRLQKDNPRQAGVFLKARKPLNWRLPAPLLEIKPEAVI